LEEGNRKIGNCGHRGAHAHGMRFLYRGGLMANGAGGGMVRYPGVGRGSPNESAQDGIGDSRPVTVETNDGGWASPNYSARPMLFTTEIASISVGSDAAAASVAPDSTASPLSSATPSDQSVGLLSQVVESAGVTRLVNVADSYFMYQGSGTSGPRLKVSGSVFMTGQFGAWMPLGAEVVGGNYQVVFKNGSADQWVEWFTDSDGNYQASTGMLSGSSYTMQALEVSFGQDFNGNGMTGPVTTTIESVGATRLVRIADSYFLYNQGTTTGPQLKINGTYASTGQLGSWAPIGAEQVNGNYQIVFQNGVASQYVVWFTDSSGNYQANTAQVSGSSWLVQGLEIGFGQNLNGDGQLGPVTTNIESAGVTRLVQRADSYFMYQGGGTSGPQLKISGAYAAAGQFGAWTPKGAEVVQGNYQLVFKNGNADQYVMWTTDSDGNYLSASAVMTGASAALKALEISFGQDFNSNGVVGSGQQMMELFGSANATGAGSSGTATLALLTNYMASAFATPAGEGTGAVGTNQSSGQDFLTKPAA
jgi:Tryptophan-rich Synechocystis species C-terminal domain